MQAADMDANSHPDQATEKPAVGGPTEHEKTDTAANGETVAEKEKVIPSERASQDEQTSVAKANGAVNEVEEDVGASRSSEREEGADGQTAEEADDESKYLSGFKLGILSLGLCLTTFVIALDNTIIATAIPKITTVFNSLDDVGWYGSSYLLTTCSLQPTFGKIYTYFDVKYTYLFALLLFEAGSIICAAATSSPMFIIGRAVAGAGAAALFSGGITIIGYSVALRKRAIYIAAISSMFGIASAVGPILGGALTDNVSWRWCFWINLPFGGVSLLVVFFFFQNPDRQYSHISVRQRIREMDLAGAVLLISGVVCLLLALQWGGFTYPWKNSKVWGTLLGFGLIISVFIFLQIRQGDRATIPIRVFKQQTVLFSCLFTSLLSMALYTHLFYLPFYFQASKGTTAEQSGIRTIAYLVSMTVASIFVGGLVTVVGFYAPFMWFGSAVFTIGSGLLYTLKVSSSSGYWIGYQVLAGFGCGCAVQIPFIAVQVVTNEKDMPTANALVMFFNSLGGAISISIAQNIFVNSLTKELIKHVPQLNPKLVVNAGATFVKYIVPAQYLAGVLEAYNTAVTTAFILSIATGGMACMASFGMEMKSVKGKKLMGGGAA